MGKVADPRARQGKGTGSAPQLQEEEEDEEEEEEEAGNQSNLCIPALERPPGWSSTRGLPTPSRTGLFPVFSPNFGLCCGETTPEQQDLAVG